MALGALALGSGLARAATDDDTFDVTATVADSCVITAGDLAFGAYDPVVTHASTALDASSTLSVTCTTGASTNITLDLGTSASGSQRRMSDGGTNHLDYELYSDSGRSTVWDDAPGVDHTGTGSQENISVYGRVPAGQSVPAASYTDTVTATITF
jgi:spore coat protein U-like protein